MSAWVVRNFIPETTKIMFSTPWTRNLWLQIFPAFVEGICPIPSVSIPLPLSDIVLRVKWPNLAVTCILGIVLGLGAGGQLLSYSSGRRGFFLWGFALVWYSMMCLGGLIHHCIEPLTAFYITDVVSTGCSSVAVMSGFAVYQCKWSDALLGWRLGIAAIFLFVTGTGIFAPQLIREQVYLVPTFASMGVGLLFVLARLAKAYKEGRLVNDLTTETSLLWLLLSCVSATLGLAALPLDKYLCFALGANGGSFLPWTFLACDIFFFCAYRFVVLNDVERARVVKSSKSF